MKLLKKPLFNALFCLIILVSFYGCGPANTASNSVVKPDLDMAEPLTISWIIPTQQGITLAETPLFKDIQNKLNITINLSELPVSQYIDKKRLLIASKEIPDVMSWVKGSEANQFGPVGAFLDLTGYLDFMPNFKSKIDASIKEDPQSKYAIYNAEDRIFMTPHYQVAPIPIWDMSYVKTAFDDIGVTKLDTWDDVYNALKMIKEKNPQYYPMGFRNLGGMQTPLRLMVESFTGAKASTLDYTGFDYDKGQFQFALDVPGYSDAIGFFAKLYTEGLIDPDYSTMDEQMLKTRINKGKIVMIAEFLGGWTGVPGIMRDINNKLVPLPTPQANGQPRIIGRKITKFDPTVGTSLNANLTGESKKLGRCLQFLDYLYSQEFYDIQWHNASVADKQLDGTYKYKDEVYSPDGYQVRNDTYFPWSMMAVFQDSSDCRPTPGSAYQLYRDNYLKSPANSDMYKPFPVLPFTVDQQKQINNDIAALDDRFNSQISAFVEGKRPMSEWQSFCDELKNAAGNDLIKIYNDAYEKIKSK